MIQSFAVFDDLMMSRLRRNTRANTSTINVKLNEKNEIEYFNMDENDVEDEDDILVAETDYVEAPEEEEEDEEEEEQEEDEEELIENADGTLSIKIPDLKPKKKQVLLHHICAKCSKVLSSKSASGTIVFI